MAQNSIVSLTVPVLILIVLEISQSARDFDLREIARRKQEPFFYSVFYILYISPQERLQIPQLGPFNFIHGMSLGLLYLGFLLIMLTGTGITRYITGLIVWIFWVVFPLLEVEEYVAIMDSPATQPISFLVHAVITSFSVVAIFVITEFAAGVFDPLTFSTWTIAAVSLVVICYYASLIGFLSLLQQELEATESTF